MTEEWRCEWCQGGTLLLPVKHQKYCCKQCKKEAIRLRESIKMTMGA